MLLEAGMTIKEMLLTYGAVGAIAAILFLVFVKEAPPTPPCPEDQAGRSDFKEGIKSTLKKKNFILALSVLLS